jgi:hypothetical protein
VLSSPLSPRALAAAAAVIALPACNTAPSEPAAPASLTEQTSPVLVKEVVWPSVTTIDRTTRDALPPQAVARVAASRVPVLLPVQTEWLAVANLVTRPNWTTASMRLEGASVVTTATRAAHRVPGIGPVKGNRKIRGTMGFVTQNERVWSATWIENNVSYSVEVECEKEADARCTSDAFVMELAEKLAYVGGAGESGTKEGAP